MHVCVCVMHERVDGCVPLREREREHERERKNEEQENLSLNPLANLSPTKQMKSVKAAGPY